MRKPLYVQRKVLNPYPIIEWAKQNNLSNICDPEKLHITQVYSKTPVYWAKFALNDNNLKLSYDGRHIKQMGNMTALIVQSKFLQERFKYFKDGGCSWDFPSYIPHISICEGEMPNDLLPYAGDIILGPEEAEDLDENAGSKKVSTEIMASMLPDPKTLIAPSDIDAVITATLKTDFVDMVSKVARELKFKVAAKNPIENLVTLRHKHLTVIVDPSSIISMFYARGLDDINAPGFSPISTPTTEKGINKILTKLLNRYDKVVEVAKELEIESDKLDKIKKNIRLNGVIDRLAPSINTQLGGDNATTP